MPRGAVWGGGGKTARRRAPPGVHGVYPPPALTPGAQSPIVRTMALQDFLRLFWFRPSDRSAAMPPPRWRAPARVHVGMRVLLRIPIASAHTTWIPAGAAGVVVGGNPKARQVSVELDMPRTVITVPWSWVEEEPEPSPVAPPPDPPGAE
jgi:hypothetical protein